MPFRRRTDSEVLAHILENSIPEPNSGCLLWLLSVDKDGYGHIRFRGKNERTHRTIWKILRGQIPEGMCVCHSCDQPSCNNVDHYWLGTNTDNTHDRTRKGRGVPTDENRARGVEQFSTVEARAAMSRAKGGRPFVDQYGRVYQTQHEAADFLNTSQACIGRVLHGQRKHTQGFRFMYLGDR
jgi:hypothetical protein